MLKLFRIGSSRALITTDTIIGRSDVVSVRLTINYDLPLLKERYLQRIGRSGCFGTKNTVINFVTPKEVEML